MKPIYLISRAGDPLKTVGPSAQNVADRLVKLGCRICTLKEWQKATRREQREERMGSDQ